MSYTKVGERREGSGNPGTGEVEDRQHGFLSAAQTRRESWALTASAMANIWGRTESDTTEVT